MNTSTMLKVTGNEIFSTITVMQPDFDSLPLAAAKKNSRKKPIFIQIVFYTAFLSIVIIIIGTVVYSHYSTSFQQASAADKSSLVATDEKTYESFSWKPDFSSGTNSALVDLSLYAKSAMVMNLDTGKVYFAENPTLRLPMASLTKEMTALLALERTKQSDILTVSDFASHVGENTMGAQAGEKYTVDDLLHALFLQSANDASETLAEGISGSKQKFVQLMNQRAKELGMDDTNYTDPYGLESNGMYTTVQDLAIITKYETSRYPQTLDVTKLLEYQIPQTVTHQAVDLIGEIDLVRTYPGTVGFKTGFTDEAGYCIVTITENKGVRLMAIVLGSSDRKADAVKMLDYAYKQEGITIPHKPFW